MKEETGKCCMKFATAAITPRDAMLVETDAPFLAPVPHRGRRNEPELLPVVGAALAAARGESVEEIAAATSTNATRAFALSRPD